MILNLDLHLAESFQTPPPSVPDPDNIKTWLTEALNLVNSKTQIIDKPFEISLRIVGSEESQALNKQYREKDKATNVLSFPAEIPEVVDIQLLGDIVICAPLVEEEAKQQNKSTLAHWAHLTIHGCLHLLGYDHVEEKEAQEMESMEINILKKLNFNNPYIQP
jgi:probable rRNA maturation factor